MTSAADELARLVDREVRRKVPGLAVVAADADSVLVESVSGVADVLTDAPMTVDTWCSWFSLTKLVTATATVQLADRGLLDLDAPVIEVYEPFRALRPTARASAVTTRHLLSHAAGVANPVPIKWVHRADEAGPDRASFVRSLLARHDKLRFEPGTRASYSNLGYLVLGEIVAGVSGRDFEEHVRAEVLEPLGMQRTTFRPTLPAPAWAHGNQRRASALGVALPLLVPRQILGPRKGRFRTFEHFLVDGAAYGGLVGPPSDAVRFLRAHLRDGELDGTRILSAASAREMRTIAARGRRLAVGLGWFRRGDLDVTHVEHLGGGAGFWSCLRIEPSLGLGVVTMGNATTYDHDALARAALAAAAEARLASPLGISDPRGSISSG